MCDLQFACMPPCLAGAFQRTHQKVRKAMYRLWRGETRHGTVHQKTLDSVARSCGWEEKVYLQMLAAITNVVFRESILHRQHHPSASVGFQTAYQWLRIGCL